MARSRKPPIILTIAGFDPSSGAGITADIKTAAAHGCYAVSCITALTVQSTLGVTEVHPLAPELVQRTLQELLSDMPPAAIKVGMLGTAAVAKSVADILEGVPDLPVVLDPILESSSGYALLEPPGLDVLRHCLLPLASVVTPNVPEAASLAGIPIRDRQDMKAAAVRLHQLGAKAVVITGGHLERPVDLLSIQPGTRGRFRFRYFPGRRIKSAATHGTGCAFATSLACQLAKGIKLEAAVAGAQSYVQKAISRAAGLGKGAGPLGHL